MIANMVAFRRAVAGAPLANWWDNGGNAIAFSRGDKGFVLINRETTDLNRSFDTGLPAGSYCDVLAGGKQAGTCLGRVVVVGADGKASLNLGGNAAVVLQAGIRL